MSNQTKEQSDMSYFIEKALTCCYNNDVQGAIQSLKRLKLLEDALIIYTHHTKHSIPNK